ncbi:MAG: fatty acid desaturase [Pseudobdellovibrionaceae bacterium]
MIKAISIRGAVILKYGSDWRSILFVLGFLLIQFLAFLFWPSILLIPLLSLGCAVVGAVNHNHMHVPIFFEKRCNFFWDFVLSFGMGASASQITVTHILIHHRFFRRPQDWTRYSLARGEGVFRLYSYLKNSVCEIKKHRKPFMLQERNRKWRTKVQREKIFLWILGLLLLAYSPMAFLFCYLIPWILGLLIVLIVNLLQHDHLDLNSAEHSRDFIGALGNWISFNSFFHTVHHERPSLHWSLLPAEHCRRKLNGEKSFLHYLFKAYILKPMKRESGI